MRAVPDRLAFFVAALLALGVSAAAVNIPNLFTAGDPIVAEDVNENSAALAMAMPVIASATAETAPLTTGPNTSASIASVDITLPTEGVVHVQATGWVMITDVGGSGRFHFAVTDSDPSPGALSDVPGINRVYLPGRTVGASPEHAPPVHQGRRNAHVPCRRVPRVLRGSGRRRRRHRSDGDVLPERAGTDLGHGLRPPVSASFIFIHLAEDGRVEPAPYRHARQWVPRPPRDASELPARDRDASTAEARRRGSAPSKGTQSRTGFSLVGRVALEPMTR